MVCVLSIQVRLFAHSFIHVGESVPSQWDFCEPWSDLIIGLSFSMADLGTFNMYVSKNVTWQHFPGLSNWCTTLFSIFSCFIPPLLFFEPYSV